MTVSFSVTIDLSPAAKTWLEGNAITPIVAALNGIRDAIETKQDMAEIAATINAAHERIDKIESQTPKG